MADKKEPETTEPLNIYQRLHAVMKDVSYIKKEDKKVNGQYTFASHDAVTAAVRPALIEHGVLSIPQNLETRQNGNRTEAHFNLRFINIDKPDDYIDVPTFGYGIDNQDKGVGKALSYGVKYALLKALSLETGDDAERDHIELKATPINPLDDNYERRDFAFSKEDLDKFLAEFEFVDNYEKLEKLRERAGKHKKDMRPNHISQVSKAIKAKETELQNNEMDQQFQNQVGA